VIRVLQLGSELTWRGGESQVEYLTEGLRARGVEVTVAYPAGSAAVARMQGRFPVLALRSRQSWDPRVVAQLARFCDEHGIQLIDAHSSKAHALGVAIKRKLPSLKLVVHRHIDNRPTSRVFTRTRYLGPAVDRYVAISEAIAAVLVDYGVARDRIVVVRSAVDPARFGATDRPRRRTELLARLKLSEDAILIGNASALTEQKGYDVLIEALRHLASQGLPVHGVFAGEGELRRALETQVIAAGLQRRVTFLGFVDDVSAVLQGFDFLAVPSNHEGLGTVILEGMLAGCPVAATAVGGIPEIITHGENGLLSPVRDAVRLADNLAQLIANPARRGAMVNRAQAKVREVFSVEKMVAGNHTLYQQLLGST
jgi:glycosyltransferase involved in cell wall biosynthesis